MKVVVVKDALDLVKNIYFIIMNVGNGACVQVLRRRSILVVNGFRGPFDETDGTF